MKLTVPDVGEVILSPTGAQVLADVLAAERGDRYSVMPSEVHPAARSRLLHQGLVHWPIAALQLTPQGRRVAYAVEKGATE